MKPEHLLAVAREARRQIDAADAAFAALPIERKREFVVRSAMSLTMSELLLVLEDLLHAVPDESVEPMGVSKPMSAVDDASIDEPEDEQNTDAARERRGTFVDRSELFVLAHPEGVTTRQVAEATNQKVPNADTSLRQTLKRQTIERRDGKWCPRAKKAPAGVGRPVRKTIRSLIVDALRAAGGTPMDTTDIWDVVLETEPNMNRASFENEMNRLRKDKAIRATGTGGKYGSAFYGLSDESKTEGANAM